MKCQRPALALALALLAALPAAGTRRVQAEPVRTLLLPHPTAPGQRAFADHLALLWRGANQPTRERLAVETGGDDGARMRAVQRGRGDFTWVATSRAAPLLATHPALGAVGVLWPEVLHAVTTADAPRGVQLPLTHPVRAMPSAGYAFDALVEWSLDKPEQLHLLGMALPTGEAQSPFAGADQAVVLFSAPAPLAALAQAQAEPGSRLRLLPFSNRLLEEFKLIYPWLQTVKLSREDYPAMNRNMVLPARYLVLVGRLDLPEPTVAKMLRTLYKKSSAVGETAPLLAGLKAGRNASFGKLFPFHVAAAKAYRLRPNGP